MTVYFSTAAEELAIRWASGVLINKELSPVSVLVR